MADRKSYPSEKQDQYMLRFPDGLRDKIKAVAKVNKRSMNAEIVARLEESFGSRWLPETFELRDGSAKRADLPDQLNTVKVLIDSIITQMAETKRR